jgi:hypothetical protein
MEGQVVDHQSAGMRDQPGIDVSSAVSIQVVQHEVDDLLLGDVGVKEIEEVDKDLLGPGWRDQAEDLAGVDEESGGEAAGALPDIFDGA